MEDLKWAMQVGIYLEPAWYPGLSYNSSADDFQALLHEMLGSCPPPCTNEPHFQAVDGAIGRVCRGLTPEDNANTYFTVRIANSTEQCKQLCRDYPGCKGIEFALSGRCEIWVRPGGILASNSVSGHECWRYVDPNGGSHLPNETTTLMPHQLMYFEGLDGGPTQDRVCRGSNENDNFGSYFTVYWTSTLEGCKSQCVEIAECKGVEYASSFGRCEVWTREEGIQAVKESPNNECWIYAPPGTNVGTIDAW